MKTRYSLVAVIGAVLGVACSEDTPAPTPSQDSGSPSDTGGTGDTGTTEDTGTTADSDGPKGDGGTTFRRHTVDPMLAGAAYASVGDMDKDGKPDIIVSSFGTLDGMSIPPGQLRIYKQGANLDTWTAETVVPESEAMKFPNQNSVDDIDGDGDLDILVPTGFFPCNFPFIPNNKACGAMLWYERTSAGYVKHVLTSDEVRFYHHAVLLDLDGDNVRDLLTVAEEQMVGALGMNAAETLWFKGISTGDRFETTKRVLGQGLGGFPRPLDLDGDGDIDFAAAEFYQEGESFAWLENKGTANTPWERHAINIDSGRSIQIALVSNLYGDGVMRAVGSNHTNTAKAMNPDPQESAIFVFDKPSDPKQLWTKHQISQGIVSIPGTSMSVQLAPGIFGTGDIDGDGDIDIAVSGDGDPNVYWLEQTAPGTWLTRVLDVGIEQAGGMVITDLNGDGKNEIVVTGYLDNVVYVYERE